MSSGRSEVKKRSNRGSRCTAALSHPSSMTVEKHRRAMASPLYRQDLDLVAVAPDGEIAAYALVWFDPVNARPGSSSLSERTPITGGEGWPGSSSWKDCAVFRRSARNRPSWVVPSTTIPRIGSTDPAASKSSMSSASGRAVRRHEASPRSRSIPERPCHPCRATEA